MSELWAKVLNCAIFFPDSGSAAATRATTAKAVIKPEAAAEPELGKNVVHLRAFGKSSSCEKFLCQEMSKYKNLSNLVRFLCREMPFALRSAVINQILVMFL